MTTLRKRMQQHVAARKVVKPPTLAERMRQNVAARAPLKRTEPQRIAALPARSPLPTEPDPCWCRAAASRLPLRPIQVEALHTLARYQGGFLSIGVGHGKSWIACLAGMAMGKRLAIVLAPARTLPQLQREYARLAVAYNVSDTVFLSYGQVSQQDGQERLRRILGQVDPREACVVLDEAHKVRNRKAARTRRLLRFLIKRPELRVVVMSGTLLGAKIEHSAHLAEIALRDLSPLPRHKLDPWMRVMSPDMQGSKEDHQHLKPLADWHKVVIPPRSSAYELFRDAAADHCLRDAFRERVRDADGVVVSSDVSCPASLYVSWSRPRVDCFELDEAQATVTMGMRPDGEVLMAPSDVARCRRQLSLGFYLTWDWPDGVVDHDWLAARAAWGRAVRRELEQHDREGYDSPMLIYMHQSRRFAEGARDDLTRAWHRWSLQRMKPQPPTASTWITQQYIDRACAWLQEHPKGVVWYESTAVGEALAHRGVPVYGAGSDVPQDTAHACAMSIRAQGTGLNLQAWSEALVIEPPTSSTTWEQLLGRLHRPGQTADEVTWYVWAHEAFEDIEFRVRQSTISDCEITGQQAKFLVAHHLR